MLTAMYLQASLVLCSRRIRLYLSVVALLSLTSCATLIGSGGTRLIVNAPEGTVVQDMKGDTLPLYPYHFESVCYVPFRTDSIQLSYHGVTRIRSLQTEFNPMVLLNIVNYGFGTVLDDITRAHREYEDIHFNPADSDVHVPPGSKRSLFCTLSAGCGMHSDISQAVIGPPHWEGSIGLQYRGIELLCRDELIGSTEFYQKRGGDTYYSDGRITSLSVDIRVSPFKGFFISTSYASMKAEARVPSSTPFASGTSAQFAALGNGIGWKGDISYVEYRWYTALKSVRLVTGEDLKINRTVFSIGLHLKI